MTTRIGAFGDLRSLGGRGQAHVLRQVLARARKDAGDGPGGGPGLDADATWDEDMDRRDAAGDEAVLAAARLLEEGWQDQGGGGAPGRAGLPRLTVYVASSRDMGNCTFYRGVKLGLEHPP
jgi:hypothetical protein